MTKNSATARVKMLANIVKVSTIMLFTGDGSKISKRDPKRFSYEEALKIINEEGRLIYPR
jgi:hypothetical protein